MFNLGMLASVVSCCLHVASTLSMNIYYPFGHFVKGFFFRLFTSMITITIYYLYLNTQCVVISHNKV